MKLYRRYILYISICLGPAQGRQGLQLYQGDKGAMAPALLRAAKGGGWGCNNLYSFRIF